MVVAAIASTGSIIVGFTPTGTAGTGEGSERMMKKGKDAPAIQRGDKRPTKAAAPPPGKRVGGKAGYVEVPSYDGPTKTDKMPGSKTRQPGPTKPKLKPGTTRRPPSSGDVELGDQIA